MYMTITTFLAFIAALAAVHNDPCAAALAELAVAAYASMPPTIVDLRTSKRS